MRKYRMGEQIRRGNSKPNKRKATPIPGLALHIAAFTGPQRKREHSAFLAATADRLYKVSERV
jgi:hypothetical protein